MAMSITKFFRKYNKVMLAIFTVGLMVAFLVPTTLREFFSPNPAKRVLGEAFGKNIRQSDLAQVHHGMEILHTLNSMLYAANRQDGRGFNVDFMLQFSPESEKLINYYLLVQEARKTGMEVSVEEADRALSQRQIPPEMINALLEGQQSQISLNDIRRAVADYLLVEHALELAISAVKISEPEMVDYFRQTSDRMTAQIVAVPAADFVRQVPAPSEADLKTYFEANPQRFEFPDRVAVEYLEIDVDRIKEGVTISRDRARREWESNPNDYMTTTMPATQPGSASAPATPPIRVPMAFEQALPKIMDKLKTEKAQEQALNAMRAIRERADRPWLSAGTGRTDLTTRPANLADYSQLADQISKEYNVKVVYHRTPLISRTEAADLPGIGRAFTPEGQRQMLYFSDYAFRIAPFHQPPDRTTGATELLSLTPYQNSVRMNHMAGYDQYKGIYLFRVTKVDPKHRPGSLAEVKDKVAEDYKLHQAYGMAKENAQGLCQTAGQRKLSELVQKPEGKIKDLVETLKIKTVESESFARRGFSYGARLNPPMIQSVRSDSAVFADAVFDKLWNQPTTQPSGVRTCAMITADEERIAYAVQLEEKKPGTAEDFTQYKNFLIRMLLMSHQQEFVRSWLDSKNIRHRTQYVPSAISQEEPG